MNLSILFEDPKTEANKSAKLIGLGIIAEIGSHYIFKYFWISHGYDHGRVIIWITGLLSFFALISMLVGTVLGFHAAYRLKKLGESIGLAWVSIVVALSFMFVLIFLFIIIVTYKGP